MSNYSNSKMEQAVDHAKNILANKLPQNLKFHNLNHTLEVVAAIKEIGLECKINSMEMELVTLSAWYHDTGFCIAYQDHESQSVEIASKLLEKIYYPPKQIAHILDCIEATRLPQKPSNLLEAIISDADMYHLATPYYWEKNELLREELTLVFGQSIRDDQWCYQNLNFLCQHDYHTPYGKDTLERKKNRHLKSNIEKLEALIQKA